MTEQTIIVSQSPTTSVEVDVATSTAVVAAPTTSSSVQTTEVEYITIDRPAMAGPPGPTGPQGPQGDRGLSGNLAAAFLWTQNSPASTWQIAHNLGFYPNITIQDSAGTIVEGEVIYQDLNNIQVIFSAAFGGVAYLS